MRLLVFSCLKQTNKEKKYPHKCSCDLLKKIKECLGRRRWKKLSLKQIGLNVRCIYFGFK
ncbi:CLUMA_CG015710, isoform A [Clunio marinus]|uniref:CLUMA_CG015710, isoform A n=1 Tax=Clunio marinus TaxID=568069 RepID=A0A1J1IV75_9DIPT|nr:CLUMA_CG015710, isoform A [Clunio marinus]